MGERDSGLIVLFLHGLAGHGGEWQAVADSLDNLDGANGIKLIDVVAPEPARPRRRVRR